MRIVFINLDRAAERRTFMQEQADRLGLAFERIRASEASEISQAQERQLNGRWERPLTLAELGCFLSHHALWDAVAREAAPVVVLEDDAVLSRRLPEALAAIEGSEALDFVNLESFERRRFVARDARDIEHGFRLRRVFRDKSGSAAYVLWPNGARKLLRRAERGAAPVDAFLHGLAELQSWQIEPAMAIQAHLWQARGKQTTIDPATSIQAPRGRLSLTLRNAPFIRRRIATQIRLFAHHLRRLGPAAYERTELRDEDFR